MHCRKHFIILCVEDEFKDYEELDRSLKKNIFFTFNTVHVSRLESAIDYLKSHKVDLILLDLKLPDASDNESVRRIATEASSLPFIVMTGADDPEQTYKAIELGAQDFVVKGQWSPSSLARSILAAVSRKEYEQKILLEKETAERISQFKTSFLANMSHEIRTPLNGVVGIASIMEPKDSRQKRQIDTICVSAEHLLHIVNNILDLSKIESGLVKFEAKPVEIRPILDQVLDLFSAEADKKNVNLFSQFDRNIPSLIAADATYIRQILCNLIGNALKFTEKGDITVKGVIKSRGKGGLVLKFEVQDTGIGIAPEKLEQIFSPFEQENSQTSQQYGGTGLGLSISKKLVELMGGSIGVESQKKHGSVFWFTLSSKEVSRNISKRPAMSDKKVSVISDHVSSLKYLKTLLTMRKVQIADHILLEPESQRPPRSLEKCDAILVDLASTEGRNEIYHRHPLKSVFFTSSRHEAGSEKMIQIPKPYRQAEIYKTLAQLFESPTEMLESTSTKTPVAKLRILLAEDDPVNQMVTRAILESFGMKIEIANNGLEALELVKKTTTTSFLWTAKCQSSTDTRHL